MPGRNLEKIYLEHTYYHIYSRGVNKQKIFMEKEDYAVFLNLFKRHLSAKPVQDKKGRNYPWLYNELELLAFCLMPNHFHALVYQHEVASMTRLFRSVMTTYGMYFNKKYKRVGPLFQSRFRASMITNDEYLQHISRYIHLNPKAYKQWQYSSLPNYLGDKKAEWCRPERIMQLFDNDAEQYRQFVCDYEAHKAAIDELKHGLANY